MGGGFEFTHLHDPGETLCAAPWVELWQGMPESVTRLGLDALEIHALVVMQLRSGRRDLDLSKERPLNTHFIVSVERGPEVSKVRSITELCGLRLLVEPFMAPKGPLNCKRCQGFGHTQRNCGYKPRSVACGGSHLYG